MSFKTGLCVQKLFFSFFFSPIVPIGLFKDISHTDILRNSQHNNSAATIFSRNLKQHVLSTLGWSLCAISSGWLPEIWSLALLVLQHWSSPGTALPMCCGFVALSQSFLELPYTCCSLSTYAVWKRPDVLCENLRNGQDDFSPALPPSVCAMSENAQP